MIMVGRQARLEHLPCDRIESSSGPFLAGRADLAEDGWIQMCNYS